MMTLRLQTPGRYQSALAPSRQFAVGMVLFTKHDKHWRQFPLLNENVAMDNMLCHIEK
jgi:hypothetical protein